MRWHLFCQHVPKENRPSWSVFSFGDVGLALNQPRTRGGSNLKAKRKRLIIVFVTLYTAKQGAHEASVSRRQQTTMRPVSLVTSIAS